MSFTSHHRYSAKDELHNPPSDDLLDNQNYETDQNHGLAWKDKQNGPDEPKISNAANSKISSIYGTKISPTGIKIMK